MLAILTLTLPIFAIIAVGYITVRRGVFAPGSLKTMGDFVMVIALPLLLFRATSSLEIGELLNPSYLAIFALGSLATQALAWVITYAQGMGPARRGMAVLGSATPNSAFLGYPIMAMVLPDHAAPILAMSLLVENFVLSVSGLTLLAFANSNRDERPALLPFLGKLAMSVLRRPLMIGLILGVASVLAGVTIPEWVDRFCAIMAGAASPIALFVIGGSLVGLPMAGNVALAIQIAAIKLILHPIMVVGAMVLLLGLGLPDPGPALRTGAIIAAGLPMFSIYTLFAREVGYEGIASMALVIATTAAFVTLNIVLFLVI